MMSVQLRQEEADALMVLRKYCVPKSPVMFPSLGGALCVPLVSEDQREEFILDIRRSRIQLVKHTFQTRARKTVVLARLDLGGPPHRNPDGKEIDCPHLHLYREGYGTKWAYPLPRVFDGVTGALNLLDVFADYCHIVC